MPTTPNNRRTALIVEDDRRLLDVLDETLLASGFQTMAIDCGQPALDVLRERGFSVLIVDVDLPDMNGMAICEEARERYGDQVVILVISGFDIHERRISSLQLFADDFMGKPFDLDEFIARIEAKLRRVPAA